MSYKALYKNLEQEGFKKSWQGVYDSLIDKGYSGNINKMLHFYLGDLGYEGSFSKRLKNLSEGLPNPFDSITITGLDSQGHAVHGTTIGVTVVGLDPTATIEGYRWLEDDLEPIVGEVTSTFTIDLLSDQAELVDGQFFLVEVTIDGVAYGSVPIQAALPAPTISDNGGFIGTLVTGVDLTLDVGVADFGLPSFVYVTRDGVDITGLLNGTTLPASANDTPGVIEFQVRWSTFFEETLSVAQSATIVATQITTTIPNTNIPQAFDGQSVSSFNNFNRWLDPANFSSTGGTINQPTAEVFIDGQPATTTTPLGVGQSATARITVTDSVGGLAVFDLASVAPTVARLEISQNGDGDIEVFQTDLLDFPFELDVIIDNEPALEASVQPTEVAANGPQLVGSLVLAADTTGDGGVLSYGVPVVAALPGPVTMTEEILRSGAAIASRVTSLPASLQLTELTYTLDLATDAELDFQVRLTLDDGANSRVYTSNIITADAAAPAYALRQYDTQANSQFTFPYASSPRAQMSMWINPTLLADGQIAFAGGSRWEIRLGQNGTLRVIVEDDTTATVLDVTTTDALDANVLQHFLLQIDLSAPSYQILKNGSPMAVEATPAQDIIAGSGNILGGTMNMYSKGNGSDKLDAIVGDVLFQQGTLTDPATLYNSGVPQAVSDSGLYHIGGDLTDAQINTGANNGTAAVSVVAGNMVEVNT